MITINVSGSTFAKEEQVPLDDAINFISGKCNNDIMWLYIDGVLTDHKELTKEMISNAENIHLHSQITGGA